MRWAIFVGASALIAHHAQADRDAPTSRKLRIGTFPYYMEDEWLADIIDKAEINRTKVIPQMEDLLVGVGSYFDTYDDENAPSELMQILKLTEYQNAVFKDDASERLGVDFLGQAQKAAEEEFKADAWPYPDVVFHYLDSLANLTYDTFWAVRGAYMGVGRTSTCATEVSAVIASKDEWMKAGSAAATTLMSLVPAYLAFGNLYVPKNSEVYSTSALVGFTSSFYSFGLPTKSISAVRGANSHSLAIFGIVAISIFAAYGSVNDFGYPKENPTLESLRRWTRGEKEAGFYKTRATGARPQDDENDLTRLSIQRYLFRIKDEVKNWKNRWHMWQLPALALAVTHVIIFYYAITPLFGGAGVPQFLLSCDSEGTITEYTAIYLAVSSLANAVVRFVNWEKSSHERIKAYAVSNSALDELHNIVAGTQDDNRNTETEMPPLQHPVVARGKLLVLGAFSVVTSCCARPGRKQSTHFDHHRLKSITLWQKVGLRLRFVAGNFLAVLRAGFLRSSHIPRWRPVYILLHLSTSARNPILTLVTGFMEAMILLGLTFFFASQWGGNLIITLFALIYLLIFTTLGRALGLVYVWLSSRIWGLTVVKCESVEELRGVSRILCSMEDVLVVVNGATYFGGHRMDGRRGFDDFLRRYEQGEFDHDPSPPSEFDHDPFPPGEYPPMGAYSYAAASSAAPPNPPTGWHPRPPPSAQDSITALPPTDAPGAKADNAVVSVHSVGPSAASGHGSGGEKDNTVVDERPAAEHWEKDGMAAAEKPAAEYGAHLV